MQEDKHYMAQRIPKKFLESVSEPDKAIAYCIERMHRELADKLLDEVATKETCVCSLLPVEKKEVFDADYSIEFKQGISVRKLVRCKDCKHWRRYGLDVSNRKEYGRCEWIDSTTHTPYEDWFCADGERREGTE